MREWMLRVLFALATCAVASAAESAAVAYDAVARAPQAAGNAELEQHAREYFDLFADGATMLDVLTDKRAYARYVELRWHLNRALDAGTLNDGMANYGVLRNSGGSYDVDLQRFPQWLPLQKTLSSYLIPPSRDGVIQNLRQRGLSEQDARRLRAYLARHPYPLHEGGGTSVKQDQLAESYAMRVQAAALKGERMQRADTLSFLYQRHCIVEEDSRAWGAALFGAVSARGRQVLESFALDHRGELSMSGSDPEPAIAELEHDFAAGRVLQRIQAERAAREEIER